MAPGATQGQPEGWTGEEVFAHEYQHHYTHKKGGSLQKHSDEPGGSDTAPPNGASLNSDSVCGMWVLSGIRREDCQTGGRCCPPLGFIHQRANPGGSLLNSNFRTD